jgi:hypothetical protein
MLGGSSRDGAISIRGASSSVSDAGFMAFKRNRQSSGVCSGRRIGVRGDIFVVEVGARGGTEGGSVVQCVLVGIRPGATSMLRSQTYTTVFEYVTKYCPEAPFRC